MNIALWIAAGLLAVVYLAVGVTKLLRGRALRRLPQATGTLPILTPVAATGLTVLQVLAIAVHVRRRETSQLGINVVLLLLAAFVAVGRFAGW
ncbi:DoxX family protein [Isoptericola variabilis]|uniref:Uncharacterized protein n=1 Tax=Isoptericola variabilis (strain 225) TaxID=743718 RepID=F6FPD1_ISOV2|nr:DoxX family protein [Isoptericola variabilis]AEG43644.1 hypothetical protein Isova_0860 [Isoptericola variabilis 225]TWH31986.1 DoxX-like protein [Isoptericola variabilis J7]